MDIVYNINNPRALNLGQQYDHNVRTVTFTGFTPVDEANTVYLKFEDVGLYPLMDMSFQVSQSFTLRAGTFKGQLFELASDGTLVQNSVVFKVMVKPSLADDNEIVENDPSITLWFTEMSELYQNVLEAYESGMLVTQENITNALGYTPASVEDIPVVPTNISDFTNDAGYISGITSEDIAGALGFTPADELDIPVVPTNVSAFTNDVGYITGISSTDVSEALGYVPADEENIPTNVSTLENDSGYITGITSEDISDALGYTPADSVSIPYVPSNVSELFNDAGYLANLTTQDIFNALQYIPEAHKEYSLLNNFKIASSVNSIVLTADSEDNDYDLEGIFVAMVNDNGIAGGANSYMFAYDEDDNVIGNTQVFFYAPNNAVRSVVEIAIEGSAIKMNSIGWTGVAVYSPVIKSLMVPQMDSEFENADGTKSIHKIEINSNGGTFAANTRVIVLGKRSKSLNSYIEYMDGDNIKYGNPTLPIVGVGQVDVAVLDE